MANEIKHLAFGSIASPIAPVAGDYMLTFGGDTTSAIAFNDNAAAVQAALEALGAIGSGNVSVTDDGSGGFFVEFISALADTDVGALTFSSSLKQAASTVQVNETQAGSTGLATEVFQCSLDDMPTEGAFFLEETLTAPGVTVSIAYDASAATVEAAMDGVVGYTVSGPSGGLWVCESDAQEAYTWIGYEDVGSPLRKALDIEIATDQEGSAGGGGAVAAIVHHLRQQGIM